MADDFREATDEEFQWAASMGFERAVEPPPMRWDDDATAVYCYHWMVRMALAAGWRRVDGWWWHEDQQNDHPLGEVIEIILLEHGVDLREPVPGEPSEHGHELPDYEPVPGEEAT